MRYSLYSSQSTSPLVHFGFRGCLIKMFDSPLFSKKGGNGGLAYGRAKTKVD